VTHRGSWTAKVGDPIYLIETTRQYSDQPALVATKVFTSKSGFAAGIRAAKEDQRHGLGTTTYRTFQIEGPAWAEMQF
jgi:hypothetical protein